VQVLLAPVDWGSFESLTAMLERRFGQSLSPEESQEQLTNCYRREGECLGALAANVRLHTQRGYPRFSPADQEDLALHVFLCALSLESLWQHVRLAAPLGGGASGGDFSQQTTSCHERRMKMRSVECHPKFPPLQRDHHGVTLVIIAVVSLVTSPRTVALRGTLLPNPVPLQGRCTLVGRLGHTKGLFVDCELDGQACRALVDTGSNITLVRPFRSVDPYCGSDEDGDGGTGQHGGHEGGAH